MRLLLIAAATLFALSGCKSTADKPVETSKTDPNGQPVSQIPWNRPAKWEGGGALGGAAGGS